MANDIEFGNVVTQRNPKPSQEGSSLMVLDMYGETVLTLNLHSAKKEFYDQTDLIKMFDRPSRGIHFDVP